MQIVHTDTIVSLGPGGPSYESHNPLLSLLGLVEETRLAAEREHYWAEQIQYLFPYDKLTFYPPAGADAGIVNPENQDNKTDFQKQNVAGFEASDTRLVRGWVSAGDWTGAFLRISYRGGMESVLSGRAKHALGDKIKLWLKVRGRAVQELLTVPYNPATGRYEVELWGFPGSLSDLRDRLDERGRAALDRGELQVRNDLLPGDLTAFQRRQIDGKVLCDIAPEHAMHPILPLHVEVAWADAGEAIWDSMDGKNHQLEMNMLVRGWDHFLTVGQSPNPHGGVGSLEYRNLMSNYYPNLSRTGEGLLGRRLEAWNFDAWGRKGAAGAYEPFMAVNYMDLHRVWGSSGIGLHRHRDNQEVFLMMRGTGLMVVGDFCKMPERERSFEVRTLPAGHFAMLRGGNLHALMNATDEPIDLFMFGGYD